MEQMPFMVDQFVVLTPFMVDEFMVDQFIVDQFMVEQFVKQETHMVYCLCRRILCRIRAKIDLRQDLHSK